MRRSIVLGIVAVTVFALSGCASSHPSSPTSSFVLPAKNMDLWVLPSDTFTMSDTLSDEANDADNVLVSRCMGEAGYTYSPPVSYKADSRVATEDATGTRRLFNETVAAQWGYENAPSNSVSKAAGREFDRQVSAFSKRETKQLDACVAKMAKTSSVGGYDTNLANLAQNWYLDAQTAASNSSVVKHAAAKWRTCLLPLGVSGLPASPVDMPTEDILSELRENEVSGGVTHSEPTAHELKVAIADATCRRSSGWDKSMYDAEWDLLVKRMQKQPDQVNQATRMIAKVKNDAGKILANYHPKS